MNKYGYNLEEYQDDVDKCAAMLSHYLRKGCLGLFLGAGVSYELELPSWKELVKRCLEEKIPGRFFSDDVTNADLKKIINEIRNKCASDEEYLSLVSSKLYQGVKFDFGLAKKNLFIALTSLMVGKTRGNVQRIISLNFDSVLEWYLGTSGLNVRVSTKDDLFTKTVDVEITHLHGYLPHDPFFGANTDFLVFSKKEFEDRQVQYNYWKVVMDEFYRSHVFLSVGLSAESILDDIGLYLRALDTWYEQEKMLRDQPYGFAFITPNKNADTDKLQKDELRTHGIIPCTLSIPEIPYAIFQIAQTALKNSYPK